MSVTLQTPYNAATGNGATTVFPYQFLLLAASDLSVYLDGVLKTNGPDYSVSNVGNVAGGNVTFAVAPGSGVKVSLVRSMVRQRLTDYQQLGDFLTSVVNPDFDRSILLAQDADVRFQTSIHAPPYEPSALMQLPGKASRLGKLPFFNAVTGDLQMVDPLSIGGIYSEPGNVANNGAVPGVDCAAIVTAVAAANSVVIFPAGAWVISSLPTIPAAVQIVVRPGATFSGTGAGLLGLSLGPSIVGQQITDFNPPVTGSLATLNIFANPHYTGGPAGVNAGLRVQVNVGANVTNKWWAIIGIVNQGAAVGVGAQVGVYGQANKGSPGVRGGPVFGVVGEAHDYSGLADPTDGAVGAEFDIFATGTDANGRRIGVDVVVGTDSGAACVATYGIRIGPSNNNPANGSFTNGVYLQGIHATGITINTTAGSVAGIDISSAVLSGPAMRLASQQYISLKADDTIRFQYDTVRFGFYVSATAVGGIDSNSGILNLGTAGAYGSSDAIISQVTFPNAATVTFSHRAQDVLRGTTRSGAIYANHTILTNITVANYRAFEIATPALQAGALVTNCDGFMCNDLTTGGTRNAAANFNVASGAGKWNLFAQGTASNLLQGTTLIGTQTDNTVDKLQVNGSINGASITTLPAGGNIAVALTLSTTKIGFFVGSGAPTLSAPKGSYYARSDGSSTTTRGYIATDAVGTWTNVVTSA